MAHLIVYDTVSFRVGIQDLVKGEKEYYYWPLRQVMLAALS